MPQMKDVFGPTNAEAGTFLGLPRCDDLSQLEAAVAIIGAPIATPYPRFGTFSATTLRLAAHFWMTNLHR